MQWTAIFLLGFSLQISAMGHSQSVTYSAKNVSVKAVFTEIKRQTGYVVLSNKEALENASVISVDVKNMPLEEFLQFAFKDQPFGFSIKGNTIVIGLKPAGHLKYRAILPPPPITVRGRIVNEKNEPVIASILIKGTNRGTTSDSNGEFELTNVEQDRELIISATNITTLTVRVDGKTRIDIAVKTSTSPLDEIQIIAYGETSRRFNTGNVSTVGADQISLQPIGNPIAALQGRVPGAYISQGSGIAGSAVYVQIRGQNSLQNGNDPLYIVDGIPFGTTGLQTTAFSGPITLTPFNNINPSDIESIEVLKDADATAIYGSRGASGVILITTKKGKSGKAKADLNVYSGISKYGRMQDYLTTPQYLEMRREAFKNDGVEPGDYDYDLNGTWELNRYTNWKEEVIGHPSHLTNAEVSLSGGNANTQFLISSGWRKESPPFDGDFSDTRNSIHFNISHASTDRKFKAVFGGNYSIDNNRLPSGDLTRLLDLPPNAPDLRNADGTLNWDAGLPEIPYSFLAQPYRATTNNLIGNLVLSYDIFPGLQLKTNLGFTSTDLRESLISPLSSLNPSYYTSATSKLANNQVRSLIAEPQVSYRYPFGRNTIGLLVGSTFQQTTAEGEHILADGFSSDAQLENIGAAANRQIGSRFSEYRYQALFAKFSYDWDSQYLLNATGRRDGSSRFGPGRQFANFGAVGAAWIFTQQPLIQKVLPFLSFGKLRMSYGITGNDQIGNYRYLDAYSNTAGSYLGIVGLIPTRLSNPEYGWETNKKLEAAIELGFLKDRILITASNYRNRSSDQLVDYSLAPTTGNENVQLNLPATILNNGWEFEFVASPIKNRNLSWTSSLNWTIPRNKLIAFPELENSFYSYIYFIGASLSSRNVVRIKAVDPQSGLYTFINKDGETTTEISYDDTDLKRLVNVGPRSYGGLQNSFRYKNMQLDILFQYVSQTGFSYLVSSQPPGTMRNQPVAVLNRWQKPGDQTNVQLFSQNYGTAYNSYYTAAQVGDLPLVDASYLRLKNLSFSLVMPQQWITKIRMEQVRIYCQAQNLLTITGYDGNDPENNGYGLPPMRTITLGFQLTF